MRAAAAFCLLLGIVRSAAALDRQAFTFTGYDLQLRLEPEQQRLGVRGRIWLRNDSSSSQKNLVLQISSSLHWTSIAAAGMPVEFSSHLYTSDLDHTGALSEAVVVLPQSAAAHATVELEIGYEGIVPQDATRLVRIGVPQDSARHSDWDQIGRSFTVLRGVGYVAWYPVAIEAASLREGESVFEAIGRSKQRTAQAEMKLQFTYSPPRAEVHPQILCSGETSTLASESPPGEINVGCWFRQLGWDLPTFALGEYSALDRPEAIIYYLPEHRPGAENYAAAVEESSSFLSKWLGDRRIASAQRPEVVDLADSEAAAFESGRLLLVPVSARDTVLLLSATHELARLAFPSPRLWINQGLAGFAQLKLIEEKEGREAAIEYLNHHRGALIESKDKKAVDAAQRLTHALIHAADEFYLQQKASSVWWMLTDMVGEEALRRALGKYRAEEDQNPAYMEHLIEDEAHRDLRWFFDDWVYGDRGLPDFRVVTVYARSLESGGYLVTVTIENLGSAAAEVAVRLTLDKGEASGRLQVSGKSKASVRIAAPSWPRTAVVNDGSVPESDTTNNLYRIEAPAH